MPFDNNLIMLFVLAGLAAALVIYSLMPRGKDDRDTVRRRLWGKRSGDDQREIQRQARESATADLVKRATPVLSRIVMPTSDEEQTNLRMKLANAGYRQNYAQTIFMGSKSVCALMGLVAGIIIGVTMQLQIPMLIGCATFCAGAGLMAPDIWLMMAIGDRKQKIRYGLPDTLDLLVVSVEAGLALDAAFKRVGDEMAVVHPELSEELRIATMETQMGVRRQDALENMAKRSALEEMRSLVSVVIQAERFGTSIAKALRNQADSLRTKRRQAAEERAQKTAVKLMIPLVLFIFPAMGIVLGGPAAINIMRALADNPMFS